MGGRVDDSVRFDFIFKNDLRESNILRAALEDALSEVDEVLSVERERENERSQDFGATLLVLCASPAVVALAKALGTYLTSHREAKVVVKHEYADGGRREIEITGQPTARVREMLEELLQGAGPTDGRQS